MICLDTNYLIGGLIKDSTEADELIGWTMAGEELITPILAWYEFLCGPVRKTQISTMYAFLDRIVIFGEQHALESARLFNASGRKRRLRVDCMIAATAILEDAQLVTNNRSDFIPFRSLGLDLI